MHVWIDGWIRVLHTNIVKSRSCDVSLCLCLYLYADKVCVCRFFWRGKKSQNWFYNHWIGRKKKEPENRSQSAIITPSINWISNGCSVRCFIWISSNFDMQWFTWKDFWMRTEFSALGVQRRSMCWLKAWIDWIREGRAKATNQEVLHIKIAHSIATQCKSIVGKIWGSLKKIYWFRRTKMRWYNILGLRFLAYNQKCTVVWCLCFTLN